MIKRQLYPHLSRLRDELGVMGLAAVVVFAAAGLFFTLVLQPMKDKHRVLEARASAASPASQSQSGDKLNAVYAYLNKPETTTDWLAKLYAIGHATGVELQSASYKTQATDASRLERYEITIPLTGSYTQMRDFLKRALVEIPILSLDQITLKRESRRQDTVQAEVRLTLHKVKS